MIAGELLHEASASVPFDVERKWRWSQPIWQSRSLAAGQLLRVTVTLLPQKESQRLEPEHFELLCKVLTSIADVEAGQVKKYGKATTG